MEQKATAWMELPGKGLSLHFLGISKVGKPSEEDKGNLEMPFLPLHAVLVCLSVLSCCFGAAWALRALKDARAPMSGWCCTRSHSTNPALSAASPAWLAGGGEGKPRRWAGAACRELQTAQEHQLWGEGRAGVM